MKTLNVDWDQLRAQKEHLLSLLDGGDPDKDFIQGIVNFIDSVQDAHAEVEGEDKVFGYLGGFSPYEIREYVEEQENVKLTDEEHRGLIYHIQMNFDASQGLNWDNILTHYDMWKAKVKEEKEAEEAARPRLLPDIEITDATTLEEILDGTGVTISYDRRGALHDMKTVFTSPSGVELLSTSFQNVLFRYARMYREEFAKEGFVSAKRAQNILMSIKHTGA